MRHKWGKQMGIKKQEKITTCFRKNQGVTAHDRGHTYEANIDSIEVEQVVEREFRDAG